MNCIILQILYKYSIFFLFDFKDGILNIPESKLNPNGYNEDIAKLIAVTLIR